MHSLEHAEEMAEARRLGGLRGDERWPYPAPTNSLDFKPQPTYGASSKSGYWTPWGLRTASPGRGRLAYLAMTAIKLLETGELEQRLAALEAAIHGQKSLPESVFDVEPTSIEFSVEVGA